MAHYEYDAWGNVLSVTDQNGNAITSATHIGNLNPFRYRGYYLDMETGLYYLMSRYYDPVVHRFINADGYFQAGGSILDANMSAYCGNNPVFRSDPTGERYEQYAGAGGGFYISGGGYGGGGSSTGLSTAIGIGVATAALSYATSTDALRQEMFAYRKSISTRVKEKAKAKVIEYANTLDNKNRNQAYYPVNPNDFHPKGLIPRYIADKGNGRIIKWENPINRIAVFEWNEDYEKGSHYHAMLISWDSHHLDGKHYKPGDRVEEPWNTLYFSD